jgi:hypothetical protein
MVNVAPAYPGPQQLHGWTDHFDRREQEFEAPIKAEVLKKLLALQKKEMKDFHGTVDQRKVLERKHADARQAYEAKGR